MGRIIFLVLCITSSAFSANYIDDFGIYVYGDIQSIQNAFILVQAVAASSAMPWIIGLITAFYLPYTAYEYFSTGSGKLLIVNITFMTASILSLDTANLPVSVHIEDLRAETNYTGLPAHTYATVDGIPYPIAFLASTVSTITDSIKTVFEDAIQLVNVTNGLDINGASYGNVGFGNALGDILKVAKLASFTTGDSNSTLFGRATTAYLEQCVLTQALNNDANLLNNVRNPDKDLFKAIDPTVLNITGSGYTMTFDSTDYDCDDFYDNEIADKYDDVAANMLSRVNLQTVGDLNSSTVLDAYVAMGGRVDDSFMANNVGKFNAYMMNMAALAPVSNAFRNVATNLSSGQDVANSITAGASLAEMQAEGAGRFKWMMEVLPLAFHYMLGVIYTISILVMIVATALGAQKGMMIWKNFAKGLMTFEFIKVALVIITSTVNQYAAQHAADFIASVGQNPATLTSIPYHLQYMATMAGIAGILGVSAIFMIPGMVFSGEVAMAAGALSGLAGKYKGNDTKTAIAETSQQKAQNDAWERELQDQAMLDHMGLSVPVGMGASEYYAQYQRGAQMANTGFGAGRMGTESMADAGRATKGQTMQSISAMETLSHSTSSMQDFVTAGVAQGAMMAGDVSGSVSAVNHYGNNAIDKIKAGKSAMTSKSISNTVGYGEEVGSDEAAIAFGELSGRTMGATDRGTYEGAVVKGVGNYLKGTENQAGKKASTTALYGKETTLKSAIDAGTFAGISAGAADNKIASSSNLEGDARTLGTDGSLQALTKAKGLQESMAYNKDGTINTTSRDEKTNQLESDKYIQGLTNQSRIATNKIQGVGRLGELTPEQMTNVQRVSQAGALGEFEKGQVLKEKYGANLDGNGNGSYSHVAHNTASLQEDKAIGTSKALDSGRITSKMIQDTTQYGMESSNLTTAEKLKKQGGIAGALHVDTTEAGLKAVTQKKVLDSQLKEGGASDGLSSGTKAIVAAIEKLANTTATKAGAQTRSDMASIATVQGSTPEEKAENYKAMMAESADIKTRQQLGSNLGNIRLAKNIEGQQKYIDDFLATAKSPEQRARMLKDLVASGWTDI